MVMSTAGVINTSSNKVENYRIVTRVSPSVPLERVGNDGRLKHYFCLEVVFNLRHKVLCDMEREVLGKGLGFSPTPSFINEADLKRDFVDFSRFFNLEFTTRESCIENVFKPDRSRCFFAFTW